MDTSKTISDLNKKLYGARMNLGRSSGPKKMNLQRYVYHLRRTLRKLLAENNINQRSLSF